VQETAVPVSPEHERGVFHRVPSSIPPPSQARSEASAAPRRSEVSESQVTMVQRREMCTPFSPGYHAIISARGRRRTATAESNIAQVKHRGWITISGYCRQGIEAKSPSIAVVGLHQRKRRRGEIEQEQEEDLNAAGCGGIAVKFVRRTLCRNAEHINP